MDEYGTYEVIQTEVGVLGAQAETCLSVHVRNGNRKPSNSDASAIKVKYVVLVSRCTYVDRGGVHRECTVCDLYGLTDGCSPGTWVACTRMHGENDIF